MSSVDLNEHEKSILKSLVSEKISVLSKILAYDDQISYDAVENEYRKLLEKLEHIEKKLS